jgi:hypothetical protein
MTAKRSETDIARLAAQIAAIASAPGGQQPQLRGQLAVVAESVAALGAALSAPADDHAARTRIADDIDRTRSAMLGAVAQVHVRDVPLAALAGTLELVAGWLRAPTPENTAGVERLVAAIRAVPGGDALWMDQVAEAKRKAELDADVQKSLDEIKAGMPKFKL